MNDDLDGKSREELLQLVYKYRVFTEALMKWLEQYEDACSADLKNAKTLRSMLRKVKG